jgi:hypothetical protein
MSRNILANIRPLNSWRNSSRSFYRLRELNTEVLSCIQLLCFDMSHRVDLMGMKLCPHWGMLYLSRPPCPYVPPQSGECLSTLNLFLSLVHLCRDHWYDVDALEPCLREADKTCLLVGYFPHRGSILIINGCQFVEAPKDPHVERMTSRVRP